MQEGNVPSAYFLRNPHFASASGVGVVSIISSGVGVSPGKSTERLGAKENLKALCVAQQ